jgi:ubiquinone/menaquinone biosynthesis C-methylase UbiE
MENITNALQREFAFAIFFQIIYKFVTPNNLISSNLRGQKLLVTPKIKQQIHQANVKVHRIEAIYYEALHPEVYSRKEQTRITDKLSAVTSQIRSNQKKALDVGAGTGNLTGKLIGMGYNVVATDISPEMCSILRRKFNAYIPNQLTVINSPIEDLTFKNGAFDLITGYSVLHHLPDYLTALRTLCSYLKHGGVIYIDHEASPTYWSKEPRMLGSLVKAIYFHSNPTLNSLYFSAINLQIPIIDYTLSDYWHKKEHALDHQKIAELFKELRFLYAKRTDYYQTSTWLPNPLSPLYRLLCSPEMSYWTAKK